MHNCTFECVHASQSVQHNWVWSSNVCMLLFPSQSVQRNWVWSYFNDCMCTIILKGMMAEFPSNKTHLSPHTSLTSSPLYTTFQAVHFFLEKQFWERWDVERGKRREDRDPGSLDWWNNKLKEPGGAGWREKYEMLLRKTKRKIQSETNWKWNLFLHGPIPYPWFLKHTSHTLCSQTSICMRVGLLRF